MRSLCNGAFRSGKTQPNTITRQKSYLCGAGATGTRPSSSAMCRGHTATSSAEENLWRTAKIVPQCLCGHFGLLGPQTSVSDSLWRGSATAGTTPNSR